MTTPTTTTYLVTATPSGRYWHVDVPAINRVTQAKSARDIETMARELIGIMTGDENPVVNVSYVVSPAVGDHLGRVREARRTESAARTTGARELRAAARILRDDEHLTLADIGTILGVSHQRAHQLVAAG